MVKVILYLTTLVSLLLLGCSKEQPFVRTYRGGLLPMNMSVNSTRAGGTDEQINTARVIVFNSEGLLVSNEVVSPEVNSGDVMLRGKAARGLNNFYIFCNATDELTEKLANVTIESELEEITFSTADITTSIPMYGKMSSVLVTAEKDGSNVKVSVGGVSAEPLIINLDRLIAKLSLTVIKNITDAQLDFVVESLNISVCRVPNYTAIKAGKIYAGTEWGDNIKRESLVQLSTNGAYDKTQADKYVVPAGVDNITFSDIYIPEYILSNPADANHATYIVLDAMVRMKNGGTQLLHSSYIINVGQNVPANHNITRNNHYDIYATIVAIGDVSAIYVESKWTSETVSGDIVVPYLNISTLSPIIPMTKSSTGDITSPTDWNYTYYFWTNRPADEISIVKAVGADDILSSEPVLTITEQSVGSDGVPIIAGNISLGVKKSWLDANFYASKKNYPLLLLHSGKLHRNIGVTVEGEITKVISGIFTPETGLINISGVGTPAVAATNSTVTFTAQIDRKMKMIVLPTNYRFGPKITSEQRIENPDGTIAYTATIYYTWVDFSYRPSLMSLIVILVDENGKKVGSEYLHKVTITQK